MSSQGCQYYLLHSTLDKKHSKAWNREAIQPLVESQPALKRPIAEGAFNEAIGRGALL